MSPSVVGCGRGDAPVGVDQVESAVDRIEQRAPVGAVVEHGRPVEAGGGRRLDEQVRPERVVGVVGEVEPIGEAARPEREVTLRVRPDRVEVDTECGRR